MKHHSLTLMGGQGGDLRVPAEALLEALGALLDGARQATRFFGTGESMRKGPRPSWVDAACALEVTALASGSAILRIDAPTLAEATLGRFSAADQMPSFTAGEGLVDPQQTAIDLFAIVLSSALAGDRAGVTADRPLLDTCVRFARATGSRYEGIRIDGLAGVTVRTDDIPRLELLRDETPSPAAVRVVGELDTISASKPEVRLVLDGGESVVVRFEGIETVELQRLFGTRVVVSGIGHFRPSGRLLFLAGEHLGPARDGDAVFAAAPTARGVRAVFASARQDENSGVSAFFGTWPGEESEAELLVALAAIR